MTVFRIKYVCHLNLVLGGEVQQLNFFLAERQISRTLHVILGCQGAAVGDSWNFWWDACHPQDTWRLRLHLLMNPHMAEGGSNIFLLFHGVLHRNFSRPFPKTLTTHLRGSWSTWPPCHELNLHFSVKNTLPRVR